MGPEAMSVEEAASYSLHGLKATVLSWMNQADEGNLEQSRMDQGHHKKAANKGSMTLYGRDDVWGALRAQRRILMMMAEGWWPAAPQARGAVPPTAAAAAASKGRRCRLREGRGARISIRR